VSRLESFAGRSSSRRRSPGILPAWLRRNRREPALRHAVLGSMSTSRK